MKKSLLLAAMAGIALSSTAQGVDPAVYEAKEGLELKNVWLMSLGNKENGVAMDAWEKVKQLAANPGKATTATRVGDYIYIACSQAWVPMVDENGNPFDGLDHFSHLVVLNANTGEIVKDLDLTLDGAKYEGLIAANCIGHDDFGHVWITPYVSNCYDASTNEAKPINLYMVDTETGAMTLVYGFEFDEIEGPTAGGRIDYCDVLGNLVGDEDGCSFMAVPNESAKAYIWVKYEGTDEWDLTAEGSNVVVVKDTYPANQGAWNYSPMGAFVHEEGNYEANFFWIDGHTTNPALYDITGELISSHATHAADDNEETPGPWAGFIPDRQANGMRQFTLGGEEYLAYAMVFPDDSKMGGHVAIVKLDNNGGLEDATPLWTAPAARLGIAKGEGRFSHSIDVSPIMKDENGKEAVEIMIYKDMNGVGVYRLQQEGFQAGVNDIVVDNSNAPVEYFNLNGVRVNGELVPGLYITRQGNTVNKVIVK